MVTARLVFDSAISGHMLGARAIAGDERSLMFSAEGLSIDLVAFEPGGGLQMVHGQIVDTRDHGRAVKAWVRLGEDGTPVETDRYGQFALSTMAPLGGLTLHARTDDVDAVCAVPPQAPWELDA